MIGKRLSDKFKIIAAVLAVLVVVSALIAYNALATDSDGSQSGLYAANGDNASNVIRAVDGVSISVGEDGIFWTTNPAETVSIGKYEYSYRDEGPIAIRSVVTVDSVKLPDVSVTSVEIEGETLYSKEEITRDISVNGSNIALGQAGNYIATVTLSNNSKAVFYAQVGKCQLHDIAFQTEDPNTHKQIVRVYSGIDEFKESLVVQGMTADFDDVLQVSSVDGVDCVGDAITEGIAITGDRNLGSDFTVKNAGTYSATVIIRVDARDNYEWEHPDANNPYAETAEGLVVEQACISGEFDRSYSFPYEMPYKPNMTANSITDGYKVNSNGYSLNFICGGNYDVELKFYTDDTFTTEIQTFGVCDSIYARVDKIVSSSEDGSDKTYRNYRMPTSSNDGDIFYDIYIEFKIVRGPIEQPSLNTDYFKNNSYFTSDEIPQTSPNGTYKATITATYKGFDYQLWQFFAADDWTSAEKFAQGAYWKVTIDGKAITDFENADATMRNVKPGNGTYQIRIEPGDNFTWPSTSRTAFEYTLTIRPYELLDSYVAWAYQTKDGNEVGKFIYNGEEVTLNQFSYTINPFGDSQVNDEVGLELQFSTQGREKTAKKDEEGNIIEGEFEYGPVLDAEQYAVLVIGLTGKDSANYSLPADDSHNTTNYPNGYGFRHDFKIYRKQLNDLSGTTVVEGIFNGDSQTFKIGQTMYDYGFVIKDKDNDLVSLAMASITCLRNPSNVNSELSEHHASVFLYDEFTATAAGYYSLTLSMQLAVFQNNYCFYGESDEPLGEGYTKPFEYEWKNFAIIHSAEINPSLQQSHFSVEDMHVNLFDGFNGKVNDGSSAVYNIVEFGTVDGTTISSTQSDVDRNANGKFKEGDYYILYQLADGINLADCCFVAPSDGSYELLNGGRQAKVYYSVSSNVASVTFTVENYTFGENFGASGKKLADVVYVSRTNMEGKINTTSITFYSDELRQTQLAASDLSNNGLPRNAGIYYLHIEVTFTVNDVDAWVSDAYTLTVSPRPVNASWTVDGSAKTSLPYDGSAHTVAVANTTLAGLPNVTLTFSGSASVTDANTYNYQVTGIDGAEKDNYTLTNGVNVNFTLTVTAKPVTVTAPTINNLTFGDLLNTSLLVPQGTAALGSSYNNEITVYVYASNGVRVTDFTKALSRDTYTLVPVWDNEAPSNVGSYEVTKGNYLITMQATTFAVVSQQMTVTLKNGLWSYYGDDLQLNRAIVSVSGLDESEYYKYIKVTAKKGTTELTSRAPIGIYTMHVELLDSNYALANPDVTETYELKARKVTITTKEITIAQGEQHTNNAEHFVVTDEIFLSESSTFRNKFRCDVVQAPDGSNTIRFFPDGTNIASLPIGTYCHIVKIAGDITGKSKAVDEDGRHIYVRDYENYEFTVIGEKYSIIERPVTLNFTTAGTSVYGDEVDLLKQEANLSAQDSLRKFIICSVDGLKYWTAGNIENVSLLDVVDFTLVYDDGSEVDLTTIQAGSYRIKATLNNSNYVITNSDKVVDGDTVYVIGGTYTVTPRPIEYTITQNQSQKSVVYGNSLTQPLGTPTIKTGNLIGSDVLGEKLALFNAAGEVIEDISKQNAANNYYVGLTWTNTNYQVTFNKPSFSVTKRPVTITPTAVTNHVYGNPLADDELKWTTTSTLGFVSEADEKALGITASVHLRNGGTLIDDVSTVNAGTLCIIKLSVANTSPNYTITSSATANFAIIKRDVTITFDEVPNHIYGTALIESGDNKEIKYHLTCEHGEALVNGATMTVNPYVCNSATDTAKITDVAALPIGGYAIYATYTLSDTKNYIITVQAGVFRVAKLEIVVTFLPNASSVYGEAVDLTKAYKVVGLVGEDEVSVTATRVGTGEAASSTSPVGTYVVVVSAPNSNYDVKYANESEIQGTYEITARSITINVNNVTNHVYGEVLNYDEDKELTFTFGGQGIVEDDDLGVVLAVYNSADDVAEVSSVALLNVGTYVIKAIYNHDNNYDIKPVNGTFTVIPREITLTFVAATTHTGSEGVYHTVYFADDQDSGLVDRTLYSSAVVTVAEGDLVNGATLRSVLSLSAVNGAHNATEVHAPAGNYTITPTVKDSNYVLKNSTVTGTYVIGKAQLTMTSSYPIVIGTRGYTGAAQSVFDAPVTYSSVNGSPVTVLYRVTTEAYNGTLDEAFFADGETALPTLTNVGNYYIYVLAKADENHGTPTLSVTFEIVPVTLTVTAKPVEITYHDELPASNWYEYAVTTEATVTPYAGLNAAVLNTYLNKLTRSTNYTTSTNAGATGITVTPVYNNGSNGDSNVAVVCVANTVTVNKANITINSVTSGHASGAYTGTAYSYFNDLSATAVNNQAITWYFSEVTGGADNWIAYNASTHKHTDVCSKQFKVKITAPNHNDKVYEQNISFVITKNAITIKADDKAITYGEALSAITLTGDISSSANGLIDTKVAEYVSAVNYVVNGYAVTTAAGSTLDITSAYTGDSNVTVTVVKGSLTVSRRSITISYVNNKSSVYGDAAVAAENLYSIDNGELVNNDKLTVTVLNGASNSAYADKAAAGTYTVTVTASDNYAIIYADGNVGTYKINKRVITVSLEHDSVTYEEDVVDGVINYHNGEYGKTQLVKAVFDNTVDELALNTHYTVTYVNAVNSQAATPNKVGAYLATIAVQDDNYVLTGKTEFDYEIVKKQIASSTFMWEESTFVVKDGNKEFDNVLKNYVAAIFTVDSFTMSVKDGEPQDVELGTGASDHNKYYFDDDGQLCITVESVTSHIYTIHFGLSNKAQANYELSGSEVIDGIIVRLFSVSAQPIESYVRQQGWQYSDAKGSPVIKILIGENKVEYTPQSGCKISYARVTNTGGVEALITAEHTGYDLEEVSHLFAEGSLSQTFDNFDVGYYVICVEYNGVVTAEDVESEHVAIRRFDVFEISKKELTAPMFDDVTYDGTTQSLTVKYDNQINGVPFDDIVIAIYKGSLVNSGGTISEKNVGKYNITFSINANYTDKYCWEENSIDDKVVSWTITQDKAENTDNKYFSVADITATYGDTIITTDPTPIDGYEGTFTWEFATRRNDTVPANGWVEDMPTYAGAFWIRITLTDNSGHNNFNAKVAYGKLTINKAMLKLTPSGTLTYGEAFDDGKYTYDFDVNDYKNGDTSVSVNGNITYKLVDTTLNGSKLNANLAGYALTAVSTLTTNNYTIVVVEGKLIVNKLAVAVTIGNATSQYGLTMDLSDVKATSDNTLAMGEVVAEVEKNLSIEEDLTTYVVGSYNIVSSYENDNYTIAYNKGTYTVTAREVSVTLDNTNAGGTYGGTINPVTFTVVDDGNGLAELVKNEYTITVVYNGTAYDVSKVYTNSVNVPKYAGNDYTATAIGDSSNFNFTLTAPTPVSFEVKKIVVDSSKITAESQMYTGEGLDPIIVDKDYNVNGASIYTVNYNKNDLVDVAKHDLELELVDVYNYAWNSLDNASATVTIKFVIAGAGIYAIPYADVLVYGATYNEIKLALHYRLVYASGINKGEDASADVRVTGDGVKYVFVDKDALSLDLDRLTVGKYRITLETVNGFVVGLESTNTNYSNIALELDDNKQIVYGALDIQPRQITITVNNSSSVYSQAIDVSNNGFKITEGSLVFDDTTSVIDFRITAVTSGWINAGDDYDVTATATAANYAVTVKEGKHTIEQIKVVVTYAVTDGTYIDKAATVKANFEATNFTGYKFPDNFETYITRKITGSKDYDSSAIPTNAGSYTVTATGITDSNYLFVSSTSETFTVAKKSVDETAITVQSKEYNGFAQSHGISAVQGVYTVSSGDYKDVDTYDVELTLVDPDNYAWTNETGAVVTKKFAITPATLTLKPSGSMIYGDAFSDSACNYEPEGFKGTDNRNILSGSVTYSLENAPDKLTVKEGGYVLVANVDNLTASNYVIRTEKSTFKVNPLAISIKPVDTESVYTQDVVLSNKFELANGSKFVFDDDETAISYGNVTCTANNNSTVGGYAVTAKATAVNYDVTVVAGTHRIRQITVGVIIRALDRTYDDGKQGEAIEFVTIVATNLGETPEPITANLTFIVNYSGTANNNVSMDINSTPRLAGMYTATVRDVDNENYTIDRTYGIYRTVVVIDRKAIDARDITAQSATYTGSTIRPEIDDNLTYSNIYTVSYGRDHENGFREVGSYDITLTLVDPSNYCWKDNLNAYTTIKFEVVKANNAIVDSNGNATPNAKIEISNWTIDDVASKPSVKLLNGSENDVIFEYSTNENGGYTTEVPTSAGTYWVRAVVAESSSYNAFVSAPVSFVINKRVVKMPVVVNNGASVYSGEMLSLDITNYDDKVMSLSCDLFTKNANGTLTLSALNAGTYTARLTLRDTANYDWEDKSKLVDGAVVVTWTIERQVLKVLQSSGNKMIVTGSDIVFVPEGFNSGIMTIRDNVRAHEGKYSAVITLKDKANYIWEGIDGDTITVEFEITGTNTVFVAIICVVAGLCVGLGVMALILTLVNRNKKRRQAADIDQRSRADGWEE